MAKVSGSYPTVILGVSEQVPQDRRPGQHFEQVNMISDPVRGLTRRPGSRNLAEWDWVAAPGNEVAARADLDNYKAFDFSVGSGEFTLLYRTEARPVGSTLPAFLVYSKTTRTFIPVSATSGAFLNSMMEGGVSALVNVGRFVYLAGRSTVPAGVSDTVLWAAGNPEKGVAWVRGGAYSRTFSIGITAFLPNQTRLTFNASHTTPASSYPGVLDTSHLDPNDSNYQKDVNDITNAYNTAVTQWIGTAAAAIQPTNIAQSLVDQLRANYPAQAEAFFREGGTVFVDFTRPGVSPGNIAIIDIAVNDGGDGTLFRSVGQTVSSVDELSPTHFNTKVVQVRPRDAAAEVFYMQAIVKQEGAHTGEVIWREHHGDSYHVTQALAFSTVENGVFYVAGSAAELAAAAGIEVPTYSSRAVGDGGSSPEPTFMGRPIHYLGMFQDRLVIGSGSTLFFSRTGDYLNWFRRSVITVREDDPVEVYALGSEDDVIRHDVFYDRNLVLFGRKRQYVINGKQAFTPQNASVVSFSAYDDPTDAAPLTSGNFAFYAQRAGRASTVHQIQTGLIVDAPESQELTKHLDLYLMGSPRELVALTSPNTVFLRTTARHSIYVYSYLDDESQARRLFDSWSKWTWNPILGQCVGVTTHDKALLLFTVRTDGTRWWAAADEFPMVDEDWKRPHVDSMRPWPQYAAGVGWMKSGLPGATAAELAAVFDQNSTLNSPGYLMGGPVAEANELMADFPEVDSASLVVGALQEAYVDPTNPYARDSNDRAIVNGRLTMTRFLVSVAETGGLEGWLSSRMNGDPRRVVRFNGRIVNSFQNLVSRQPLVDTAVSIPVGREVRDFRWRILADTWLPLTITAIEWVGQLFLNTRRV